MVAEMGFVEFSFYIVQICIGLFAIIRSDAKNDAMFDPDVCGAFVFCGTLLVVLGCRERAV